MAKRTIGPFELEKQLGVGGMGTVYLATYRKTRRPVALKVLAPAMSADERLVKRFDREIGILKKLQHEHIVRCYGGGRHGTQHFYAMELMDGGSLQDLLAKRGRLSWEQTIEIARQVCQALQHAHGHGIVHRDLKPANLFFTKDGQVKLGDFGIARDMVASAITAAGKTVGTYAYMAPEQITGKIPVSPKTDLYALGCVMYEMLTGQTPFQGETAAEMLFQHLDQQPPRPTIIATDCPIWLETVVLRLLEKEPDERYFDALAVEVALDEVGRNVAEQASVTRQTVAGGTTLAIAKTEKAELRKLLGRKKKRKKRSQGPFYERLWFLATCLVLLVAGVTWAVWPLSEDQLYQRAKALMDTGDADQWRTAEDEYLGPLLERFPESEHVPQVREWMDEIELERMQRRAETAARLNLKPKSEAERFLIDAVRSEQESDRITALAKYRGMVELLKGNDRDRLYVRLAQRRIDEIHRSGSSELVKLIDERLNEADELDRKGRLIEADKIWTSIITAFGSNKEFEKQVEAARMRRDHREADPDRRDAAPDRKPAVEEEDS